MKKTKSLFLICSIAMIATFLGAACVNSTRTSYQRKTTINRLNRNVKIGFQGLLLGTPNKDVPDLINKLPNISQAEIPVNLEEEIVDPTSYGSIYADKDEKITASFMSTIIDTTGTPHTGYGVLFSDRNCITQIIFRIETEYPEDLYNLLLPLFTSKYGAPDKKYEVIDSEYNRFYNNGASWIFNNKNCIKLNCCTYEGGSGPASDLDYDFYGPHQRVEIIYQDFSIIKRRKAKEMEERQKKAKIKNAEIDRIKKIRKSQQL